MEVAHPALTLAVALGIGVFAQALARHLRVPGIVLLLAAGAGLGPDGLGWIYPRALGSGLFDVVDFAVAVVLFEGGLNLEISRLRREQAPIRRLVTLGAVVTLAGGTVAVLGLLGWEWGQALLFGSLVVVTGPTVVGPLLAELRLSPRVSTVLEAEAVLIDPIGALLAVLVLEFTLSPGASALASGAFDLLLRLGFGAGVGVIAGLLLAGLLKFRRLVPEGFENVTVLAGVLLLFQACDALVPETGILAVTVAGVVLGNLRTRMDRDLREFKDQLTVLLIGLLFVLLAADVRVADIRALGMSGVAVVSVLVLIVRPLGVWISTLSSGLSGRERLLIAWIAPRGIVAAAVASLTAGVLESRGLEGGTELRALVFLTIAGTVSLAGASARLAASLLGLRLPGRETVAILGAQGLGLALADELKAAGQPVLLLDSNPHNCRRAEDAGLPVIFGNALEERTLQRGRFESVGTVVGLTANETLNGMFVNRARELFGVPSGYVALARLRSGVTPELVRSQESRVLFEALHDVDRWDVRARHGELLLERRVFSDSGRAEPVGVDGDADSGELFVILTVRRGEQTLPMWAAFEARDGDVAVVAVHAPEHAEADRALERRGWRLAVAEA